MSRSLKFRAYANLSDISRLRTNEMESRRVNEDKKNNGFADVDNVIAEAMPIGAGRQSQVSQNGEPAGTVQRYNFDNFAPCLPVPGDDPSWNEHQNGIALGLHPVLTSAASGPVQPKTAGSMSIIQNFGKKGGLEKGSTNGLRYLGDTSVSNVDKYAGLQGNGNSTRSDSASDAFDSNKEEVKPIEDDAKAEVKDDRIEINQQVLFEVDKAVILPESEAILRAVAQTMKDNEDLLIEVHGHTDSDNTEQYNLDLSMRRAAAVRDFLVNRESIEASRLTSQGFGESLPIATNDTPEGKQKNRRVEFKRFDFVGPLQE